jgi:hypothetical protein
MNALSSAEVGVGRRETRQPLVIAAVIVVVAEVDDSALADLGASISKSS